MITEKFSVMKYCFVKSCHISEKMADPPRFEHGFEAPQAPVISRLHYGSSVFSTDDFCITPTVGQITLKVEVLSSIEARQVSWH